MRKVMSVMLLMLLAMTDVMAKGEMPQYEITGAGSGTEGTVLVKVYVYAKKVKDCELRRAAVHGVVFRGFSGNESGVPQPAMAPSSAEMEHAEFCNHFFSSEGPCQGYATIIDGTYDRVKTAKGYKMGAVLRVDKTALRQALEQAGIVRSLSSGF